MADLVLRGGGAVPSRDGVTRALSGEEVVALRKAVSLYLSAEEAGDPARAREVAALPPALVGAAMARLAEIEAGSRPATAEDWAVFLHPCQRLTQNAPASRAALLSWCQVAEEVLATVPAMLLTADGATALARVRRYFPTPADILTWMQEEGGLRDLWRERRVLAVLVKRATERNAERNAERDAGRNGPRADPAAVAETLRRVCWAGREDRSDGDMAERRGPRPRPAPLPKREALAAYEAELVRVVRPEARALLEARIASLRASLGGADA